MFWKINFRQPSAIDGLLDKEDCSLNEILDEDDVLQECKTQNKRLIDFLCKPENLQQLVQYVCHQPSEDDSDKVRFKYPHLACEILTADVFNIVDALTTSDIYLPMLWGFLDEEPPMNPLVGSFVSKVLMMMLTQRITVFLDYVQKREDFINCFLKHLGTSAIMDLLLQMIMSSDGDQNKIVTWLKEVGIIEKLVDCIHPEANVDQCINASQAICDMIRISRDNSQVNGPSPLLVALESEKTIVRLLDNMFAVDEPPDWTIVNGILILLTMLEKKINTDYSPTLVTHNEEITSSWEQAVEKTLNAVCPRIKNFHQLLSRKPSCEPVLFTVGVLDPPLGNMRLKVVQLFSTLLQSQDVKVHREIINQKTCAVLLSLFFQYPWNNFLHTYVELSVTAILNSNSMVPLNTSDDTGQPNDSITLRQHLLKECELVQRLLAAAEFNDAKFKEDRGCRQGYMGHLIRMANQVAGNTQALAFNPGPFTQSKDHPEEGTLHEELDKETFDKWNEFMSGVVFDMNKKNSTNLGGNRPINSSIEDSDEEFDPLNIAPDNELEKAFQQYQDIRFTNQLVEEYGADDLLEPTPIPYATTYSNITSMACSIHSNEEHTQHMATFEAVYTDRIHQFDDDDTDSDEDESSTWVEKDLSFASPNDLHSSSGEEGEGSKKGRGVFPSGSSDDDEDDMAGLKKRRDKSPLIIEEKKTNSTNNDLGEISWKADFSNGASDTSNNNWADFSQFTAQHSTTVTAVPSVVTTTYVSVSELEGNSYVRLSADDEDIVMDPNLLDMGEHGSSGSSDDDVNSSDDDRSASYAVTSEGDSGNPLLDPTSPSTDADITRQPKINSDDTKELEENYRFLSSKGLITGDKHNSDSTTQRLVNESDMDGATPPSDP